MKTTFLNEASDLRKKVIGIQKLQSSRNMH